MTKVTKATTTKVTKVAKPKNHRVAILRNISFIAKAGKRFDQYVHETALMLATHIQDHGDITLAEKLFQAMPKGSRLAGLKDWFHKFTKLRFDEEGNAGFSKEAVTDISGGTAKPWYDCKPEAPYKPLDLASRIAILLNEATKRDASEEEKGDKIDTKLLASLKRAATENQVVIN